MVDKCEAVIKYKTLEKGRTDGLYDLYGKRITLPQGVKESPTVEETTITCQRCDLSKVFNTQGVGFAAYNQAVREAREFLQKNCAKWQEKIARGDRTGGMPDSFLPQ